MSARPRLRALVLAAGRGERLRPLTAELPKPLLPVAGRPLAAHTLDALADAGCETIAINLHHLGDAIRARFGTSWRGRPLVYSEEPELLGTGGALPPLAPLLAAAQTVLVVNGDSLCRWPLRRLLAAHRRCGAAATLLVARRAEAARFGGGIALERGRVVAFRPGALAWRAASAHRVFAGAAALDPALLARLPAGPSDVVAALYEPLLAEGATIAALDTARAWHDLGTAERYLDGALAWALAGLPARGARLLSGAEAAAGAVLRRVVAEAGARVASGARLRECVLLPNAEVGAGARLERVVVGPGARVASGTQLARALVTRAPGGGAPLVTPFD